MPKWEPDFESVRATTRIFDRGEYELVIARVTGFAYDRDDGKHVVGVRLTPRVVGKINSKGKLTDDFAGEETFPIKLYLHNEGARRMTKRILMALCGFSSNEEDAFNQYYKKADFSIEEEETEDGYAVIPGAGWRALEGKHVRVTLDKDLYEPDGGEPVEQQTFSNWTPVK